MLTVAEYLFARLHQLGIRSIFGVPGDYNLQLLDYVEPSKLHWVGTCNELNAGYATDGYSRIKGLGAFITTYGVGELSAINAIAGAYAERAPIIHIVGTPKRQLQEDGILIHHTLIDGNYRRFAAMATYVTVAQANLIDVRTATSQIDSTLQQCLLHSRPVYIELPDDMVHVRVDATALDTPITVPSAKQSGNEDRAIKDVIDRIKHAKQPMLLIDGEIRPFGIIEETKQLIKSLKWPTWTTGFAKGLIDEPLMNVYGIYQGAFGDPETKHYVDSCDLVLWLGPHLSDTNTYIFTALTRPEVTVMMKETRIDVGTTKYEDTSIKYFMTQLLAKLNSDYFPTNITYPKTRLSAPPKLKDDGLITHQHLWKTLSGFIQSGDIVLGETGTASYGIREFELPANVRTFSAISWLSIGYMLPATLGASIAQSESVLEDKWNGLENNRTILFIGDGSFQMTAQEISTMIKQKLNIIIFLINNKGYTIERCIHGRQQKYNDVADWNYLEAPSFLGISQVDGYRAHTFAVKTWKELSDVLEDHRMKDESSLRMVEVFMDQEDAPPILLSILNKQKEEEILQN